MIRFFLFRVLNAISFPLRFLSGSLFTLFSPLGLVRFFSRSVANVSKFGLKSAFSPISMSFKFLRFSALIIAAFSIIDPLVLSSYLPNWQNSYVGKTILFVAVLALLGALARALTGAVKIAFWVGIVFILSNQVLGYKKLEIPRMSELFAKSGISFPEISSEKIFNALGVGSALEKPEIAKVITDIASNGFTEFGFDNNSLQISPSANSLGTTNQIIANQGLDFFGFESQKGVGKKIPNGVVPVREGVPVKEGVRKVQGVQVRSGVVGNGNSKNYDLSSIAEGQFPDLAAISDMTGLSGVTKSATNVFGGFGDEIFFSKPAKTTFGSTIGSGSGITSGISDVLGGMNLDSIGSGGDVLDMIKDFDYKKLAKDGMSGVDQIGDMLKR